MSGENTHWNAENNGKRMQNPFPSTLRYQVLYMAWNSKCSGTNLPEAYDDSSDPLGELFAYTDGSDAIKIGTGEHKLYQVLLRQPYQFDNQAADRGMHNARLRADGIFGSNDDADSYVKFDLSLFKSTYNMEAIYIAECQYTSKHTLASQIKDPGCLQCITVVTSLESDCV